MIKDWTYKKHCGKCHGKGTRIVANMLKTCVVCMGRGYVYKIEKLRKAVKKDFRVCNEMGRSCMNQYHIHGCDIRDTIPMECTAILMMARRQGLILEPLRHEPDWLMEGIETD